MSGTEEDARQAEEEWRREEEAQYAEEARIQAYYDGLDQLFQEGVKNQAKEAVKSYLGRNGDAVDQRVLAVAACKQDYSGSQTRAVLSPHSALTN